MAGYPPNPPGYGYGAPPPNPYGSSAPPNAYGAPPPPNPYGSATPPYGSPYAPSPPYGEKPPKEKPQASAYGNPYAPSPPYGEKPPKEKPQGSAYGSSPYDPSPPYGEKPPKEKPQASAPQAYGGAGGGYGSPFAALMPSAFPQGTDPSLVACFQHADQDGSGFIDDKELQRALSSYSQSFSIRTVHLLMYLFTNSNTRRIGPKEFTQMFYSLQNWRAIFERFDRDRSGKIDSNELRDALLSLGFAVSQVVLELLVSKFDKSGGKNRAIEYDNFIECCLTVKGLTEKFKEKDTSYSGSAAFTYEMFMLTVLPFLVA